MCFSKPYFALKSFEKPCENPSLSVVQWFLTFFAPWTPKSKNNFHGALKCYYVLLADPLISVKVV